MFARVLKLFRAFLYVFSLRLRFFFFLLIPSFPLDNLSSCFFYVFLRKKNAFFTYVFYVEYISRVCTHRKVNNLTLLSFLVHTSNLYIYEPTEVPPSPGTRCLRINIPRALQQKIMKYLFFEFTKENPRETTAEKLETHFSHTMLKCSMQKNYSNNKKNYSCGL